jgi:AcrR family transcriptional regulator
LTAAIPQEKGSSRGDKRRKLILSALHGCIIEKGYAKTTLADVAEAAGMYPSHLLYYYNGKEAVLEHFFQNVSARITTRIDDFQSELPEEQIRLIAELFFAGAGISKSEIGFMLECFGVAVGDKVLRREKSDMDQRCKASLTDLFKQTPGGLIPDPRDAAEVAYATLIGLRSAVYFDDKLNLRDAHRLFRSSMLAIAGLPPAK